MAFLRMELLRSGSKTRYHFMIPKGAPNVNVARRVIANTMHLRSTSAEWELCHRWVKNDRSTAPT
eukprot:3179736-Lingulodinium_polyedra.AAC.1